MARREDYLAFLAEMGYSEAEVLDALKKDEMTRQDHLSVGELIGTLSSVFKNADDQEAPDDVKEWATSVFEGLTANTNWLLQTTIDGRVKKRLEDARIVVPVEVYPGVFPTNDFNARAVEGHPGLVLLDTACFELVEAFIWISMLEAQYQERVESIAAIARKLFDERTLPAKALLNHRSLEGAVGKKAWITGFTTAAEEFVLAHEYGHVLLHARFESGPLEERELSARELEADQWAAELMLRPSAMWGRGPQAATFGYQTEIGGIAASLGIAHFMEQLSRADGYGCHPTASSRARAFLDLLQVKGLEHHAGWAIYMLDMASAVAIYLVLGDEGLRAPQSEDRQRLIDELFISAPPAGLGD